MTDQYRKEELAVLAACAEVAYDRGPKFTVPTLTLIPMLRVDGIDAVRAPGHIFSARRLGLIDASNHPTSLGRSVLDQMPGRSAPVTAFNSHLAPRHIVTRIGHNVLPKEFPAMRVTTEPVFKETSTVRADDVIWEMTWPQDQFPDKPPKEMMFEEEPALARLLAAEVLIVNSNWWHKDQPDWFKETISVAVNCNDVFAWGCADAEPLPFNQIQPLYEDWMLNKAWGPAVWCCRQRKELPQHPILKGIVAVGKWDMEALAKEHGWSPNRYDNRPRTPSEIALNTQIAERNRIEKEQNDGTPRDSDQGG